MKHVSYSVIVLLVMAVAGVAAAQEAPIPNPIVVNVNGEPIHAADISVAMSNIGAQIKNAGQEVTQDELMQICVGRLIDQKLLAQEAERLELVVDETRILTQVELMTEEAGGLEALEKDLAQGGMSVKKIEQTLRELDLARLYVDTQIRSGVEVSEDDVKVFYNDNKDAFKRPETVRARHILAKVDEDADEATRKAARDKIVKAREKALAGGDFAELAKEMSDCPSSERGGDLGFFAYPQMVQPFSEAAFSMQPGGISEVVETEFGYHVIKVEERNASEDMELADISERVRSIVTERKVGDTLKQLLTELREQADIEYVEDPQGGPPTF